MQAKYFAQHCMPQPLL